MEGKEIIKKAEQYSASLNGKTLQAILPQRQKALNTLKQNGFPKSKSEAYKFTNVSKVLKGVLEHSQVNAVSDINKDAAQKYFVKDIEAHHLVFVNGEYKADFSNINPNVKGISIASFEQYADRDAEGLQKIFGQLASAEKDALTALNTVYSNDGLVIEVANKAQIELPIICYHIQDAGTQSVAVFPRTIYKIGKSTKASIVHLYHTIGDNASFVNEVNEIVVEENAHCHFYKIQNDTESSYAIGETKVHQSDNSVFTAYTFTLEGAVIRNNLNIDVDGQGAEANMYGLYLLKGKSHIDNNTAVDHIQPNSNSNELYKGVMDEKSRGVFNGRIYVRREAQKTNAFQSNNNILLSDTAIINTKPQLEIWADDVKCSHGCTIGQLDEEGVFYLRSRGIGEDKARAMMLNAFAADVLEKVEFDWLRTYLEQEIETRLDAID